jgi:hypothetical protein
MTVLVTEDNFGDIEVPPDFYDVAEKSRWSLCQARFWAEESLVSGVSRNRDSSARSTRSRGHFLALPYSSAACSAGM